MVGGPGDEPRLDLVEGGVEDFVGVARQRSPLAQAADLANADRVVAVGEADPSGLKATERTEPIPGRRTRITTPVRASQRRTVSSSLADATMSPSGWKATALSRAVWPRRVAYSSRRSTSQSLTVLSLEAEASVRPSGLNAKERMASACLPRRTDSSEKRTR